MIKYYVIDVGIDYPFVILGGAGTGKSAVMARVADVAFKMAALKQVPGCVYVCGFILSLCRKGLPDRAEELQPHRSAACKSLFACLLSHALSIVIILTRHSLKWSCYNIPCNF